MAKFFKLVQNEYIKILHNISTWIMLALIVLAALGLNVISLVVQNANSRNQSRYSQSTYSDGMYDSDISYQKEAKPEGYQQTIENYEFLISNKIAPTDWRYEAASDMTAAKTQLASAAAAEMDAATVASLKKSAQDYRNAILANSWEDYYNVEINRIDADTALSSEQKDAQKWQYRYSLDNKIKPDEKDWKANLVSSTAALKTQILSMQAQEKSGADTDTKKLNQSKDQVLTNMYQLEHNISVDVASAGLTHPQGQQLGFWDIFSSSSKMITLISLLIIVIAGSCVANEFSGGTIKFLLINPVKRGKILLSKYVMTVSFAYLMLLFFYAMNILFTMLFYGSGNLNIPYVYVGNGTVHSISGFAHVAWLYLLSSVDIVVMATLAFTISSLVRSSALAIGIGVFAMLGGKTLILFLKSALNLDWARYLIFANTDLSSIIDGTSSFAHQSVAFALIVVAVHMVVFLLTAWDGFVRREV